LQVNKNAFAKNLGVSKYKLITLTLF